MAVKYIIKDIISKIGVLGSVVIGVMPVNKRSLVQDGTSLTRYGHMMLCAVPLEIRHFIYMIIVHSVAIGYQLSLGINQL